MFYGVETLPAGTEFHTWAQLTWASPLEVAFFTDVLHAFSAHGSARRPDRLRPRSDPHRPDPGAARR